MLDTEYQTPEGEQILEEEKKPSMAELKEGLTSLVGELQTLADEQVSKKLAIEERWLEDLRQYYGKYDIATQARLETAKGSKSFVNMTRSKTNSWEARLSDMLFPTDDSNWGIKPTPVPEFAGEIRQVETQTQVAPDGTEVTLPSPAETAKMKKEEAAIACGAMSVEIEDQLKESEYNIKCRLVLRDSCKLGTGVMKGPTISSRSKRNWKPSAEDGKYSLHKSPDVRPQMEWVDPWSYFPDMDATRKGEEEFEFQRHLFNKKQLRDLAKLDGFNLDGIRELLLDNAREGMPTYLNRLSTLNDVANYSSNSRDQRYHVWEYHGTLTMEQLHLVCDCLGVPEVKEDYKDDPLEEIRVIIWFCQGHLLKFGEYPLDSGDSLFSVFNLEEDDTSIFGFGVPNMMRDSQRAINAAWRMVMDNSALSTGPQIVINEAMIEPADGDWGLVPRKIWLLKNKNNMSPDNAFRTYHIDGRQEDLLRVIDVAKAFSDEETSLPLVAQGESGSHQTTTSGGLSMLMNSVNVVFRRVVKNYDDGLTVPNIRRMYDFNMQFSAKEYIKGDYTVIARGSSVLLIREMQSQTLMTMLQQFSGHPVLGPLTKVAAAYRQLVKTQMLSPDSIVKTDEEIEMEAQAAAEAPPAPDMEMMKLEAQKELMNMEMNAKIELANMNRELELMKMANAMDITMEQLRTQLGQSQLKIDSQERQTMLKTTSDERKFAAEIGIKKRTGEGI